MAVSLSLDSGPKFRVAICGAGIGGLVLAITIGKYDPIMPIDLYEAHDTVDTAGVGIALWKQVHDVLIELDLFDDFKEIFTRTPENNRGHMVRRADIPEGGYFWYHRPHQNATSIMHRQHMVAVLKKHLPPSCTVHIRKRLVNYIEEGQEGTNSTPPIRLEFADGASATTDVLIGADGIRSAVRKTLFETEAHNNGDKTTDFREFIDPVFTRTSIYRFLVSTETLRKESPENRSSQEATLYCGKGGYLMTYPIAKGTLINVVAVIGDANLMGTHYEGHWVTDTTRGEVVGYFDHFEPDAKAVMKLCEKPSKWALHVVKPLPFCVQKKVALIGDACHAMAPALGAGAGQAIDDAFVLGRLLAHPLTTLSRIPDALRIYEEIRLPFAQSIARLSLSTRQMYVFMEPSYYDGTRKEEDLDDSGISAYERDGMETMKKEILRRWTWIDDSKNAVEVWKEAELKLRALANTSLVLAPSFQKPFASAVACWYWFRFTLRTYWDSVRLLAGSPL